MLSNNNFPKLKLDISSCLLGNEVRFDGGHKCSKYIQTRLARFFDFQTFCPEVGIGLGIPHTPIRLIRNTEVDGKKAYAVNVRNNELDYTTELH